MGANKDRTDLKEAVDKAFVQPWTHRWSSERSGWHWIESESYQDGMHGPLMAIAERGGCAYVYTREDIRVFEGIDCPDALLDRLRERHSSLLSFIDKYCPSTDEEVSDKETMPRFALAMWPVVVEAMKVEESRWKRENS